MGSAVVGTAARGNTAYGYAAGMGWRRPGSREVQVVFEAMGKTKEEALRALAQLADKPLEGEGKVVKTSQVSGEPASTRTRRRTKKVEVTVTFDLPDNLTSLEEVERLLVQQWRAQLPEVRRSLLEEAGKKDGKE